MGTIQDTLGARVRSGCGSATSPSSASTGRASCSPTSSSRCSIWRRSGSGLGAFIQQGGINGQSYVQFVAPGLLASNAMFAASFESTFNTFVKLKIDKIYDAIITTPVNAEDVVAGEYLWAGTRAALYGTAFPRDASGPRHRVRASRSSPRGGPLLHPADAARDRHHVQRDGDAVYQPDQTHRPLRLLLHPGRDARYSSSPASSSR